MNELDYTTMCMRLNARTFSELPRKERVEIINRLALSDLKNLVFDLMTERSGISRRLTHEIRMMRADLKTGHES